MIHATQLTKQYAGVTVLNLPDLLIPDGESFGLVGNNGAGKTTFFSLILDLVRPSEGMVSSNGRNVAEDEGWKAYTGSYLDERHLIDFLTPEEYFEFIAGLHAMPKLDLGEFYARMEEFFNNEVMGKKKYVRDLSRGNQKKVGIAASLMAHPSVVILDEPFPHLDPSSVIKLKRMLQDLRRDKKTTMLISSHDLNHVMEVCQRIVVLEHGNIVYDLQSGEETLEMLKTYFGAQ